MRSPWAVAADALAAEDEYGYRCYLVVELDDVRLVYHQIGMDFAELGDDSMRELPWCPECVAEAAELSQQRTAPPATSDVAVPSVAVAPPSDPPPTPSTPERPAARSAPKSRRRAPADDERGWVTLWSEEG